MQTRFLRTKFIVPRNASRDLGAADGGAGARHTARRPGRRAQGERDAGPLGAVVGGTVGAVAGTVGGILGVEDRPRFREYVIHERHPSYRYDNDFRVGVMLPESGVTYYDVPTEYHVQRLPLRLRERPRGAG